MKNRRSCLENTIKKLTADFPTGYEMLAVAYGVVIYPQIWAVQQVYGLYSLVSGLRK